MNSTNELFRIGKFSLVQCETELRWNSVIYHDCHASWRAGRQSAHSAAPMKSNRNSSLSDHSAALGTDPCHYCGEPTPEAISTAWILHNFDLIGDQK